MPRHGHYALFFIVLLGIVFRHYGWIDWDRGFEWKPLACMLVLSLVLTQLALAGIYQALKRLGKGVPPAGGYEHWIDERMRK